MYYATWNDFGFEFTNGKAYPLTAIDPFPQSYNHPAWFISECIYQLPPPLLPQYILQSVDVAEPYVRRTAVEPGASFQIDFISGLRWPRLVLSSVSFIAVTVYVSFPFLQQSDRHRYARYSGRSSALLWMSISLYMKVVILFFKLNNVAASSTIPENMG